ncbi:DUF4157 domain-containing protein [Nostoc piscinale]|uniref:eCIS core domain-containing protein n=1 Tax=Nostoc piscinale TaxID=224012 RepID=UPI0007817118|nr:DUF4157 domain-containing protein [Nostoc piscinale]
MYTRVQRNGKSADNSSTKNPFAPRPFKVEETSLQENLNGGEVIQNQELSPKRSNIDSNYLLSRLSVLKPEDAPSLPRPGIQMKLGNGEANESYQLEYQPQSATPRLQMKLTIGQAGDKYEQEADRVAKDVVQRINSTDNQVVQEKEEPTESIGLGENLGYSRKTIEALQKRQELLIPLQRKLSISQPEEETETTLYQPHNTAVQPLIQRVNVGGMAASDEVEAGIQRARSGGQPIADSIREPMEQAFGSDFSGVRVHTDAQADQLNQSIQAKAFTTGQDVFFRQGAYKPGSRGGQELLAHELTHVVQQNGRAVMRSQLLKFMQPTQEKSEIVGNEHKNISNQTGQAFIIQRYLHTGTTWTQDEKKYKDLVQKAEDSKDLYDNAPDLTKDLIRKYLDSKSNWESYDKTNPETLHKETKKTIPNTELLLSIKAIRAWIKKLNNKYNKLEKKAGFTDQHKSFVTPKEAHKNNWQDWVENHIANIPVNPWTDYTTEKTNAIEAAKELDKGDDANKNYTDARNTVNKFAENVKINRSDMTFGSPITPTWTQEPIYGTGESVTVEYIPGYSMPKGSGNSITTPIDWFYGARKHGTESSAQWVRGHLLNDHVGGPAKHYNLAPLDEGLNLEMEFTIEYRLKQVIAEMIEADLKGTPQKYSKIKYVVQLGSPSTRQETAELQTLANDIDTKYDPDETVSSLKFSQKNIITALQLWGRDKNDVKKRLEEIVKLWKMEDQLIRDWAIKLEIEEVGGEKTIIYKYLENIKRKKNDLNVNSESITNNIQDAIPTKTLADSLKNKVYLEASLASLSESAYQFVQQKLYTEPRLPEYEHRVRLIENWVNSADDKQLKEIENALTELQHPDMRRKTKHETSNSFVKARDKFLNLREREQEEVKNNLEERKNGMKRLLEEDNYPIPPNTPDTQFLAEELPEEIEKITKKYKSEKEQEKIEKENKMADIKQEIASFKILIAESIWSEIKNKILDIDFQYTMIIGIIEFAVRMVDHGKLEEAVALIANMKQLNEAEYQKIISIIENQIGESRTMSDKI